MSKAHKSDSVVEAKVERTPVGTLSTRSLSRVLFVLHTVKYNGVLYVSTGRVVTSFPIRDGEVGCCVGDPDRQRRLLLSRFGHTDAEFEIVGMSGAARDNFQSFGDPRELILEGIVRHTPYAELLWGLGFYSRHYPIPTQHLEGWGAEINHGGIARVLNSFCSGRCSVQMMLGGAPHEMLPVVRALYFGLQTDLVHMSPTPRNDVVELQYTNVRADARRGHVHRSESEAVEMPAPPSTRPTARDSGAFRRIHAFERVVD